VFSKKEVKIESKKNTTIANMQQSVFFFK